MALLVTGFEPAVGEVGRSPLKPKGQAVTKRVPKPEPSGQPTRAIALRIDTIGQQTQFVVDLEGVPHASVVLVANPARVVIDIPDLAFDVVSPGVLQGGFIKDVRYGLLEPGKARIVLDLTVPVRIDRAEVVRPLTGPVGPNQLVVALSASTEQVFRAQVAEQRPAPKSTPAPEPVAGATAPAPRPKPRPVVVIDPGHGGVDPGAVGVGNVLEKSIVLAVARLVKAGLASSQRYDIILTRSTDVFVPLQQRLDISASTGADLFISIHADSVGATVGAQTIRGATVYTLSDSASDEEARRLAEKENAVDVLAGFAVPEPLESDQVRDILIDLMKRETANFSSAFRTMAVAELRRSIALSRDPNRSAAFRVLRQTRTPAVLIELGYMSNAQDQALMTTPEWQQKVAKSIATAIDAFFAKRIADGG